MKVKDLKGKLVPGIRIKSVNTDMLGTITKTDPLTVQWDRWEGEDPLDENSECEVVPENSCGIVGCYYGDRCEDVFQQADEKPKRSCWQRFWDWLKGDY